MEPASPPVSPPVPSLSPVVVVGTDFSPTAAAALDWAVELAGQQGASLDLVHAVTVPPSTPGFIAPGPRFDEEVQSAARDRLAETAGLLRERGIAVEAFLGVGAPAQVIVERAEKTAAAAVVIGTRGLSGLRHLLLGSTASRVIHGAPCPVLSVHPDDLGRHRPIRTVLVPTDFSHDAELAIHAAHELLAPLEEGARLVLLHAFNLPIEYTAYGPIPTSIHYLRDTGLEAERRLAEAAEALAREGLQVETAAKEGDPATVIADEAAARGADLIAMGTHGHSGLRHFFLGSTAERVVQHAGCPVMTIRRRE